MTDPPPDRGSDLGEEVTSDGLRSRPYAIANRQACVKGILKAELKQRGIGYWELAERLTAAGTPESERNIANKISRGGFSAAFFVECLAAIGCTTDPAGRRTI